VRAQKPTQLENENMEMPYLIKKNGSFYAHESAGYTARPELAELYTKQYAQSHADAHNEVQAVAVNEVFGNADQLIEYIERMQAMVDALKADNPTGE